MSIASKRPRLQGNEEGFSLVELAIVLVIIGLIIGGVLKGQDLIHSARLNAVQTTVDKVATAVNTFQGKYLGVPGDIVDQSVVSGSLPTTGGNGNGVIDGSTAAPVTASGGSVANENLLFWADLGYANMLDGVSGPKIYSGTTSTATEYDAATALSAATGGYFTVLTSGTPAGTTNLWLQLGVTNSTNNDGSVFSVADASTLDKKFDDGSPTGGTIRAIDKSGATGTSTCLTSGSYSTNTGIVCALQFQIN